MNALIHNASTIERPHDNHVELRLSLAYSTQSPPPPVTVTLSGRGSSADLAVNLARVAVFDRAVVSDWLKSPGPEIVSTGPVLWQHTAEGVVLTYCGEHHRLDLVAVTALTSRL